MSRLDQHVSAVQNKLALGKFLDALARAVAVFVAVVLVAILIDRFVQLRLPRQAIWFWASLGAAGVAAIVWAVLRRPSPLDAAVRIDDVLQTKDKFATALQIRPMNDAFAQAAVLDAERTADTVSLHKRFPLKFPSAWILTLILALVALGTYRWMPSFDLFGTEAKARRQAEQVAKNETAKKQLRDALATVSEVQKAVPQDESIKLAKEALLQQLNQPVTDPTKAQRTAARALQDVNEAIKQQIRENQKYAQAETESKMLRQLQIPIDEQGPVADAQRAIAKGEFKDAVNELQKLADNFEKLEKKDQEKAAEQMQNLANQLKQMAQDPQQQKQMEQQLQQMGANQHQAQDMAQKLQQAAAGDKQAQQQLQQMAQQLQQQMNNGQGPNQQQQQQIQQMMQQMQAQANAQQQAQQMQNAAQQMAKAMQQAANPQQGQNAQQQGQGQQQQQQGQQQMAQGLQGMQQQLQQMQAMAADAQQIGAAQQNAAAAAQQAMNAMNGQGGQQQAGQGQWQGQGNNQGQGNQNQPWNGQANNGMGPNQGGIGAGDRSGKEQAPYAIKQELDPSADNEKGKILAATLVKSSQIKGESKEQLKEIAENAEKNAADEIEQDRISRQSQRVVREYFGSMQKDAESSAPPATQPSN